MCDKRQKKAVESHRSWQMEMRAGLSGGIADGGYLGTCSENMKFKQQNEARKDLAR